jgi:hypothetical protein
MSPVLIENKTVINETAEQKADSTLDVIDMGYIDPSQAEFTETEGKILSLKLFDIEYPRVVLHRSFPHTHKTEFISIRDIDNKEIGIIRDTCELDEKTQQLFERHLSIRYFAPNITKINSVKDEFGYCFWDTETTQGNCRFVVRRDSKNILSLANFEILVIDIDGNRFVIPDIRALSEKETKMIELFV